MSAPEFDCGFLFFLCACSLGARRRHFEIFGGERIKSRFATTLWKCVLLIVFAQRYQRSFGRREGADRCAIVIKERKASCGFPAVAAVRPQRSVKSTVTNVETGNSTIARIARGDKLATMFASARVDSGAFRVSNGSDVRCAVAILDFDGFSFRTSCTKAILVQVNLCKSLILNICRCGGMVDATDLKSVGP